ncbi:MAG: hypothetical protein ABS35_18325 [Kaistia sp. SCN 65-12]|nr:MAG: hypothetical protein ABS35_18325 [Kaistia sp. SCN 65-12]
MFAIATALGDLIRKRQVGLGLPCCTDANIDGGGRHPASPTLILAMKDGPDLVGKEGAKQSDLFISNGKRIRQFRMDDIAVWRAEMARGARTVTRIGGGRFLQRLPFLAVMCEPVIHLLLFTAWRIMQPEEHQARGTPSQPERR